MAAMLPSSMITVCLFVDHAVDEFTCMALSADDRTLVCGSELTRRLYVYDIHDKVVVRSIGGGGMGRGQFDRPQKV